MHSYDLSANNREIQKRFVKLHIALRSRLGDKSAPFLAKLFSEIGNDNYWFWRTLYKNFHDRVGRLEGSAYFDLQDFYDFEQEWYNEYSIQENNRDEWLSFNDLKWYKEKTSFKLFWSDALITGVRFQSI